MQIWGWVAVVIAIVALVAWYLSYTAARLDRLHARVEGSLASLDAQIVRRAEMSLELANSSLLDPASSLLLAEAAAASLEASESAAVHSEVQEQGLAHPRSQVESELTHALRATLTPDTVETITAGREESRADLERLREAGQRVQLARRFHNDAVNDVRRVRSQPMVRLFRLAGRTSLPDLAQFDDDLPEGL